MEGLPQTPLFPWVAAGPQNLPFYSKELRPPMSHGGWGLGRLGTGSSPFRMTLTAPNRPQNQLKTNPWVAGVVLLVSPLNWNMLRRPEIVGCGGLGGQENPAKRWGAKRPTFGRVFLAAGAAQTSKIYDFPEPGAQAHIWGAEGP